VPAIPDDYPRGDPDVAIFIAIMLVGFVLGTFGHINKSNKLIIIGIVLIFSATILLPLLIFRGGR
jgi:hypothetical protein